MDFLTETPADAERRRGLRKMRIVATSLLGLAAVVYVLTLPYADGGWGYVNTASEAAMVGAIADWFAVTALFKHPLGLPIPHTALIKRRKDELGRNLQEFVSDNFLTEEIARDRLRSAHVVERVGVWLRRPESRERVLTETVRVANAGLMRVRDDEVRDFLDEMLLPRLVQEPISPIAGALLDGIVDAGNHTGVVDLGLDQMIHWLEDNPGVFADVMGERAPWWSPPWLDQRVIDWGYKQVMTWLQDIRHDPLHPARQALDRLLHQLAHDLQHNEDVQASAEALKERLLTHPQVPETVVGLWQSFRTSLLSAMDDRESYYWKRGDVLLTHLAEHLATNPEWQSRIEGHLGDAVAFAVNTYGSELAEVISITVDRWDAEEASQRIELFVGKDLQFIRINGTVIGALAGLVIHTLSQLIH
ncbi:DUF445 domain-containing protein [Janibacter sp. GXQ6167]|uniref:DUF445 domain-containing protein n=1 Tax=Janibacter sp. GXQ6167 TaxID=3240791 RepID=UPI0035265D0F